jgi:PilZ domain
MDRREHHRVHLNLPLRIRWNTPFAQKTEVCRTVDISRGGLLAPCREAHAPGAPLWVTFPFDTSPGDTQPEMLARVVRAVPAGNWKANSFAGEGSTGGAVAVHFVLPFRPENRGDVLARELERRDSPRRRLALPVRVRPSHIPWFEEAMTIDVSTRALRFLSCREYQAGQLLRISFEPTVAAPWPAASETAARVVRIEGMQESAALTVTIVREP